MTTTEPTPEAVEALARVMVKAFVESTTEERAQAGTWAHVARAVLAGGYVQVEWEPSRWYRAIGPGGDLWCETSDLGELRRAARPDDRLKRLWQVRESTEWRDFDPESGS